MKLVIVDYGMGNIRSIVSALNYIGVSDVRVSDNHEQLNSADKVILPGVGNFAKAMREISVRNLDSSLIELVSERKTPILGICLGMQLLGKSSTEAGFSEGLGLIDGVVSDFPDVGLKVPHVGYNQVKYHESSRLYQGLEQESDFYFTHSFRMCSNEDICQATCDYSGEFVASFELDNIAGVQFHPELSQVNGLNLLRNFVEKF